MGNIENRISAEMLDNKIDKIFNFLKNNRSYNYQLQKQFHFKDICLATNKEEKVIKLLYSIFNTQSQPKIDKMANFMEDIHKNKKSINSFSSFVKYLHNNNNVEVNYDSLFKGLKNKEGWGNKTSALFVKNIYHFHNNNYPKNLKIWDDTPSKLDKFYLPVDAVIMAVFNKLDSSTKWDFDKINKELESKYTNEEIEIWDDLWFWGFITQRSHGKHREHTWNKNKYWILPETIKDEKTICKIKAKAEEFLRILKA